MEVAESENREYSKFTIVSDDFGTEIYNWMKGRISNIQGVLFATSPTNQIQMMA